MSVRNASPSIYYGNIDAQNWSLVSVNTGQTKTSKNAVASHAVTTTTMESATTTVEGLATSGILRVNASLMTLSSLDKPQDQFDKILQNKRCPIHPKSNHSMLECTILRKSFQSAPADAPKKTKQR